MNDTSTAGGAPGASLIPDSTGLITGIHLTIIVVLAILAVIAIVWGMRLKARRKAAEAELRAHNEAVADAAPADTAADGTAAAPARSVPPPVAPSPPPLADAPVVGTPAREPLADEPIAAAAPGDADHAAVAAPPAPVAADGDPAAGAVTQVKGLGPKVAARLAELGIATVGQLAALDDDAAARLDADLGSFKGRLARDRWIEQARLLAAGDKAAFETEFGRL